MICAMAGCEAARVTTMFCDEHARRLRDDPQWCPIRVRDDIARCGLCDVVVVTLRRNGEPDPARYVLEWDSHPEGTCRIEDGGFTVTDEDGRRAARRWGTPLYRSHPRHCPARAKAAGSVT